MRRHIDDEILSLKNRAIAMGRNVEVSVQKALGYFQSADGVTFKEVLELEKNTNQMQIDLDEECLRVMAAQSPLAGDLRMILSLLKMNSDFERMGDIAKNIIRFAKDYHQSPALECAKDIHAMGDAVVSMVGVAVDCFESQDVMQAQRVLVQDDEIDAFQKKCYTTFVTQMKSNPDQVDSLVHLLLISRNLERLGDHATNIAEDVIFAKTGKDVRHGKAGAP